MNPLWIQFSYIQYTLMDVGYLFDRNSEKEAGISLKLEIAD